MVALVLNHSQAILGVTSTQLPFREENRSDFSYHRTRRSVQVVSIGGVAVSGSEVTFKQTAPASIVVEARFVPPGTAIQLEFFPDNGSAQGVTSTPLEGTFELSRATASIALPSGTSHYHAIALWKQPDQDPDRR